MQLNIKLKSEYNLKKKEPLSRIIKRGYRTLFIVVGIGILGLMGLYMLVTNWSSQQGYILTQEQQKAEEMEYKNREIEKEVTKSKSLENISERDAVKGMKKQNELNYVKDGMNISVKRD